MKSTFLKKILIISALCMSPLLTVSAEMVNINNASAAAMAHYLKGIGDVKASSIVKYRELNGDFKNINDLTNVKGIGQGLLKKNLEDLSLTVGVVKWIKMKPKVVAIDGDAVKKTKAKKFKGEKVASKVVNKSLAKKVKKKKSDSDMPSAITLKKKSSSDKAEFMK